MIILIGIIIICGAEQDDEEGEGYLEIEPDTNPEDVTDEGKKSTLSRSVQ